MLTQVYQDMMRVLDGWRDVHLQNLESIQQIL